MVGPFTNPNAGFSSIWKTNLFELDVVDVISRKVLWIFGEVINRTVL